MNFLSEAIEGKNLLYHEGICRNVADIIYTTLRTSERVFRIPWNETTCTTVTSGRMSVTVQRVLAVRSSTSVALILMT